MNLIMRVASALIRLTRRIPMTSLSREEQFESYFTEENRQAEQRQVHVSPCEMFTLTVDYYKTKKGSWNYSRGRVYHHNGETPIADVKRNYAAFPFSFIQIKDDDYLVCGSDYQGQTFVNLNRGTRRDELSKGAKEGYGFCWANYELMADGVTLKVEGCHWACPYEYKFYDVSDPMGKGWPLLELPEGVDMLDEGEHTEISYEDGHLVWRQYDFRLKATGGLWSVYRGMESRLHSAHSKAKHLGELPEAIAEAWAAIEAHDEKYPDPDREDPESMKLWEPVVDHLIRLRNEGGTLVLVEEQKSEALLDREKSQQKSREARTANHKKWLLESELHEWLGFLLGGDGIARQMHFMYPSQVSRWDGETNPAYFLVTVEAYDKPEKSRRSASLSWGVETGPIKLERTDIGRPTKEKLEFPRTQEGLYDAYSAGQAYLRGGV